MQFRLGELFNGPGGLALGAANARVKKGRKVFDILHTWANDIDESACQTYVNNICPDKPEIVIVGDIRGIDIPSLDPIDAFAYGFPCNDFSIVGEHQGLSGSYGPLYSYGVSVLYHHKPEWFFAENVGGLGNANEGMAFEAVLRDLEKPFEWKTKKPADFEYNLVPHLYKFEEYGVPQTRHRIIIIGIRKDLGFRFKVPAPTTPNRKDWKTAKEAVEIPPIPEDAYNNEYTKQSATVIERLKYIPPGENAWYEGIPDNLRLNVKGAKLSQIYRRLQPNTPSYTITGSGGGGTHGYHWEEPRALTNRERARLQTFPDDFIFSGGKESVRKQIGMAVPPDGAKIIFEAVLKTFAGINYETIPSKWTWKNGTEEDHGQMKLKDF